jgi:hypothetical protein
MCKRCHDISYTVINYQTTAVTAFLRANLAIVSIVAMTGFVKLRNEATIIPTPAIILAVPDIKRPQFLIELPLLFVVLLCSGCD